MEYPRSQQLYERASGLMSGGLHSNGRNRKPHPIYMAKAQDAYVYDLDGNRYVDLIMGNGTMILGHNNPEFNERMTEYAAKNQGLVTGFDTVLSVDVAEHFLKLTGNERVRFTNTGTEAVTHIIHIARFATGRNTIAVMEGAYDGWADMVYVNCFAPLDKVGDEERPNAVPGGGGLDPATVSSTLVLPFNNIEATEKLVREHKDDLAAIILEPIMIDIGFVEATPEYIHFLRNICDELGIVLVFDELLTGFRIGLGGCQEYYGVRADLCMYGKAYANGYITAAVAGKAKYLDHTIPGNGVGFIGTFNGHQISLCAAAATLDMLDSGEVTKTIMANADTLRTEFGAMAERKGAPVLLRGKGGHFQVYFVEKEPTNYRQAAMTDAVRYGKYVTSLQEQGVWCSQAPLSHHVLSVKHGRDVLDEMMTAMENAVDKAFS